jgi:hypothetical protein
MMELMKPLWSACLYPAILLTLFSRPFCSPQSIFVTYHFLLRYIDLAKGRSLCIVNILLIAQGEKNVTQ